MIQCEWKRLKERTVILILAETSCPGSDKLGHPSAGGCILCSGNYEIILMSRERRLGFAVSCMESSIYLERNKVKSARLMQCEVTA